jgi:hypothetical protein
VALQIPSRGRLLLSSQAAESLSLLRLVLVLEKAWRPLDQDSPTRDKGEWHDAAAQGHWLQAPRLQAHHPNLSEIHLLKETGPPPHLVHHEQPSPRRPRGKRQAQEQPCCRLAIPISDADSVAAY